MRKKKQKERERVRISWNPWFLLVKLNTVSGTSRSEKRQAKGTIYLINTYNHLTVREQRFFKYRNCLRDRVLLVEEREKRTRGKQTNRVTWNLSSLRRNRDKITAVVATNKPARREGSHCDFLTKEIVIAAVILRKELDRARFGASRVARVVQDRRVVARLQKGGCITQRAALSRIPREGRIAFDMPDVDS